MRFVRIKSQIVGWFKTENIALTDAIFRVLLEVVRFVKKEEIITHIKNQHKSLFTVKGKSFQSKSGFPWQNVSSVTEQD